MWHSRHFMSKKMACRSIRQLWICSLDVSFPFVPAKMVQKLVYLSFLTVMIFVMPCGFPCGFPWKQDLSMETGCSHGKVMRRDPIRLTKKLKWPNIWRARRQFQLFQCSFSFRFLWTLLDSVGFCWIFAILM